MAHGDHQDLVQGGDDGEQPKPRQGRQHRQAPGMMAAPDQEGCPGGEERDEQSRRTFAVKRHPAAVDEVEGRNRRVGEEPAGGAVAELVNQHQQVAEEQIGERDQQGDDGRQGADDEGAATGGIDSPGLAHGGDDGSRRRGGMGPRGRRQQLGEDHAAAGALNGLRGARMAASRALDQVVVGSWHDGRDPTVGRDLCYPSPGPASSARTWLPLSLSGLRSKDFR